MPELDPKKIREFVTNHIDRASKTDWENDLCRFIDQEGYAPDPPIDTKNDFLVGVHGSGDVPLYSPSIPIKEMTKDEAVRLAAWLVAMADPSCEQFNAVLHAVMNT